MASTINLTIKSELTQAQAQIMLKKGSDRRFQGLTALKTLLKSIPRQTRAIIDVQTGGAFPVASNGTLTLATVVATDVAEVGGNVFTFSAGAPSTEDDVNVTVASAAAFASATDLAILTGIVTETSHGFLTGDVGQLTTSSAIPTGWALSTDYFIIRVDANSYKIASSLANAEAGTPVLPTDVGVGNQTFTPNDDKSLSVRLRTAINDHLTIGQIARATVSGAVVTVTCNVKGVIGNFITLTSVDSTITASGSGFLASGTGGATDIADTYSLGL